MKNVGIPLQNDHNVYILGAGFSRDAGLPLISDFLLRMRDSHEWLQQQGREREAEAVAEVLRFRLEAASASYWVNLDLENIEELFSLASASAGGVASKIQLAIAATLDYALTTRGPLKCIIDVKQSKNLVKPAANKSPSWLEKTDSSRSDCLGSYELGTYALYMCNLLGMLKDGTPNGENTFITFNYDTILEDALIELGLPVTYGSALGHHPTIPAGTSPPNSTPISVFKLHGSLNWARSVEKPTEINIFKDYGELSKHQLVPELVPPTWKKVFENQLETVWQDAIAKLNSATRIIVIGFSMPPTDMHFKYLLAAGLQRNVSLRQVLFVNPDENSELEPRAKALLRESYVGSGRIAFAKRGLMHFSIYDRQFENTFGLDGLGRPTEYGLQYDFHQKP